MEDDELLTEFLVESRENLDRLERELLAFEGKGSPTMLAAIFRTAHTVKGNAGFFGYTQLQHLMHTAESLLSRMRDGEIELTSPIVSTLLDVVDAAREILNTLEASRVEGAPDLAALLAQLVEYGAIEPGETPAEEPEPAAPAPAAEVAAASIASAPPPPAPPTVEPVAPAAPEPEERAPKQPASADTTIRVDTGVLDQLVNLAGELVLARNQLLMFSAGADPNLVRAIQRLDGVTSRLQESVMRTRMQPIGVAWAKLPRVVRDLSGELGKQVRLELDGQEAALDRSILEAIRDPLTHLVRNAIDHGIETPERRRAAGKPEEGTLSLLASHAGAHVSVEIRDDGNGIDADRVARRAVERGLITSDRAARMTEAEIIQLIFAPGFSTAEKITSVSGRGVGMDVVKTNIEAIGGTVNVAARRGEGTSVKLTIPLTLAIMPTLLVAARGQRYAIAEAAIIEILRIDPSEGERGIEYLHGAPFCRRHGELVPVAGLGELLHGEPQRPVELPAYIAMVATEGGRLGLVVDDLLDFEEIVVKPIGKYASGSRCFGGATVRGDGQIALILDVNGLAREAGLRERRTAGTQNATRGEAAVVSPTLLVVRGRDRRLAIPLSEVTRLEEFATTAIERAGRREVVQYHGKLLPLIRLGEPRGERATVIVHTVAGSELGLLVEQIVDVFHGDATYDAATAHHGIRGSAVIAGFATDIVDVSALAAQLEAA